MKQFSLSFFVLLLIGSSVIFSVNTIKKESKNSKKNKVLRSSKAAPAEPMKETEVWFQKVYSGTSPKQIIHLSENRFQKFIVSVNKQILVLKTIPVEAGKSGEVFDTAILKEIYDKRFDDAKKNKCCARVKKVNYQECSGDCTSSGLPGYDANNCLEIGVGLFTWRLCSENKAMINGLDFQLKTNIISVMGGKVDYKAYIENGFVDRRTLKQWDWHNQLQWGGKCVNNELNLQSPIILDNPEDEQADAGAPAGPAERIPDMSIDYYFDEAEPIITKDHKQVVIGFNSYVGLMRINVGDKNLVYQPNYISFRFNSEHQIASKRFDGEVLVHMTEVNPDKKSWLTNGLVVSIFLEPMKETSSLSFIEDLKLDFWKLELKQKNLGIFKPDKPFSLQKLFDQVFKTNPKYYLYKGSNTTPPCLDNVLHLVFDRSVKIPEIQFKVIREQSLLDLKEKEIHARLVQQSLSREIVRGTCKDIKYNKNLDNYLDNGLPAEYVVASRLTQETSTGENNFANSTRESLKDAEIKFDSSGNKSVYKLEKQLRDKQSKGNNGIDTETAELLKTGACS
jgi:carbonic anhydrase